MSRQEIDDKVRLLRALAFHIQKKVPAAEALGGCFEDEGRGGRHRQWRRAVEVLGSDGFVPALVAAGLVGDEVAVILAIIGTSGNHRLLSDALKALADYAAQ